MTDRSLELALRVKADTKQVRKSLNDLERELRQTGDAADVAAREGKKTAESVDRVGRSADKTRNSVTKLAASIAAGFAVHEIVRFTASMVDANVEAQRIEFTLKQVFGEDAAEQYAFVRKEADRLGLSLADTAEAYAQLAASAQGTEVSTENLQKVFVGMNEAATVLHTPVQDVTATFVQLAQGISLGKLQMQDIRAIAQHLPGTMTILQEAARRLGTTLEYSLAHGGLDAAKMIGVIGDVMHERFGQQAKEASHSLNAELNRLKTTLFEIQTDDDSFEGKFAEALRELNDTLNDPEFKQGLEGLISALGTITTETVKAASELGQFISNAQKVVGFSLGSGVYDDATNEIAKQWLAADQAELQKREAAQNSGPVSRLNAGSARLRRLVFTWSDSQTHAAWISTKELREEIQRLSIATRGYTKDRAKANEADQEAGMKLAAGDFIDSILAPSKKPTPRSDDSDNDAARKKAAALTKAAAAANQQLRDTFIQLQAAQDPTAEAWARYNTVVGKANQRVTDAKTKLDALVAAGKLSRAEADRRIAANKALANGIEYMARKTREAAIDKLADADRETWEKLKQSLRTPTEVKVDTALAQIKKLNDFLKEGVITSEQYHQAITRVAQGSVTQAPQYQGIDAAVGGVGSELAKNFRAQSALDAWHQQQLAANEAFRAQDTANEEAYQKRKNDIEAQYAKQSQVIQESRNRLALTTASNVFGQLATLSTSHNRKMAKIGKTAAIAQAVINTYQSATEAYASLASIPYVGPELGAAAAAAAIAAGLANVAQIRAQPIGGYAIGGYTGNAPVTQAVGLVHGREGVLSAPEVKALGGEAGFNALRRAIKYGYADGGYVNPLANVPPPSIPAMPRLRLPVPADAAGQNGRASVGVRIVNVIDPHLVVDAMNSSEGERVIKNVIARNGTLIKQTVNS